VPNRNASVSTRDKVDVVNADGHVRDDLQIRGHVQQRAIDGVCQHGVHADGIHDFCSEHFGRNRSVLRPHPHISDLTNALDGIPWWATGDDDL